MDLGVAMARTWWRPVWGAWLAAYVPAAIALGLAFRDDPWLGALLLWWLKPLFDRFALHVLSRAVFGEVPRLRNTLGAWRELLQPGLLASLTVSRLNPARSFLLPVWQLERQTGNAARARRRALQRRLWAHAVWLTVICMNFEAVVLLSLGSVLDMFVPAKADPAFDLGSLFSGDAWWAAWSWTESVAYALAVSIIEPLYVAAGFALYLDRRTRLEGWDLEVALRRLALRLGQTATLVVVVPVAALALVAVSAPAYAAAGTPKQEIAEVLKAPEFQTQRDVSTWVYRGDPESERGSTDVEFWNRIARVLAKATQTLGWAALLVLAIMAVWFARRLLPAHAEPRPPSQPSATPSWRPRPREERLPDDVAQAAAALASQGRFREALSLLYRGALAAMAMKHGLGIESGDTESDCLHRAGPLLGEDARAYFVDLVASWQHAAYSVKPPDSAHVAGLCASWPRHFRLGDEPVAP